MHNREHDHSLREDNEYNLSDEGYSPHGKLDGEVRKIWQAAFESTSIEMEDEHTLINGIGNKLLGITRKPWFKEVAIVALILLFKTGLIISYREAHKANLEITDL